MRKLKIPLLILLTIVLLVVGASLPKIAAAVQDHGTVNTSGYSDMESVELVFSEKRQLIPLLGKLALIRDGNFYTASFTNTAMTKDDVKQAVEDGLSLYYQAELIPYNWKDYEFNAVPHLVYSSADEEEYGILWIVTLVVGEAGDAVTMYVDDETGLILCINYQSSTPLELYTAWGYLNAFSNAYLTSTGLAEVIAAPEDYGVSEVYYSDAGLQASGDKYLIYTLVNPNYGTIELQFWLYEQGFYMIIV